MTSSVVSSFKVAAQLRTSVEVQLARFGGFGLFVCLFLSVPNSVIVSRNEDNKINVYKFVDIL